LSWLTAAGSFLAGGLLGAFFFGGLWWTVQKMAVSDKPYLVSVISFVVRAFVTLVVLYFLLSIGWVYLLVSLAGFITARTVLAYKLKPETAGRKEAAKIDHQP